MIQGETNVDGSKEQWRRPEEVSRVRLEGVAIVDSQYGPIEPPTLPDGYMYQEIQAIGSRPWGIILRDNPEEPYDWRELVNGLPEDRFLFHQLTLCVPQAPELITVLRQALQQNLFPLINYDDFSLLIQGEERDQLSIVANRVHLTRGAVNQLMQWVESLLEEVRSYDDEALPLPAACENDHKLLY